MLTPNAFDTNSKWTGHNFQSQCVIVLIWTTYLRAVAISLWQTQSAVVIYWPWPVPDKLQAFGCPPTRLCTGHVYWLSDSREQQIGADRRNLCLLPLRHCWGVWARRVCPFTPQDTRYWSSPFWLSHGSLTGVSLKSPSIPTGLSLESHWSETSNYYASSLFFRISLSASNPKLWMAAFVPVFSLRCQGDWPLQTPPADVHEWSYEFIERKYLHSYDIVIEVCSTYTLVGSLGTIRQYMYVLSK